MSRSQAMASRAAVLVAVLALAGLTVARTWADYPSVPPMGYRLFAADGGVFASNAPFVGAATALGATPMVEVAGAAGTPSGFGYWVVTSDGEVVAFGDARPLGSAPADPGRPAVAIAATPTGKGYWVARADGSILAFGDAPFAGDALGRPGARAVSLAARPDGRGYWLLRQDGEVLAFGAARTFAAVAGSTPPTGASVDLASAPDGVGYWVLTADGGVTAYGRARFDGSPPRRTGRAGGPSAPFVAVLGERGGDGYWVADARGRVRAFGGARDLGGTEKLKLAEPIRDLVTSNAASP